MVEISTAFLIYFGLFVGTFLCGYLPSCIKALASPKVMNMIAIFGGGTIIGTAMVIVLPESVVVMINTQNAIDDLKAAESGEPAQGDAHEDGELVPHSVMNVVGAGVMLGFSLMLFIDELFKII